MSLPLNQEIFKTFSLVFDDLTNNKVVFGDKACSLRLVVKSACLALQFLTTDTSVLKRHEKNSKFTNKFNCLACMEKIELFQTQKILCNLILKIWNFSLYKLER